MAEQKKCELCGTLGDHECPVEELLKIFGGKVVRIEESDDNRDS